jgi:hypothetical protein
MFINELSSWNLLQALCRPVYFFSKHCEPGKVRQGATDMQAASVCCQTLLQAAEKGGKRTLTNSGRRSKRTAEIGVRP